MPFFFAFFENNKSINLAAGASKEVGVESHNKNTNMNFVLSKKGEFFLIKKPKGSNFKKWLAGMIVRRASR